MNDNAGLDPVPVAAHDCLLALFQTRPLIALGEAHWLDQQRRLIRKLLSDERFVETVDAVVVEFGNALHQAPRACRGRLVAPRVNELARL